MARVPGREPYRVRLYPHGVPWAPGGPAGAVRLGTSCRSLHLPVRHSPCPAAGSPQGRRIAGLGMLNRWAARTPGAPRHERQPGAASSSAATAYQRRHARAVQGRNDRRVGRRDGATCLPPPAGNPVQAGDARAWYYPRAPHTGQAPMPWPARTRWATAICWAGVARLADEAYRPPP
jgi:hypothetical protein